MSASEKLNGIQFQYDQPDLGESTATHRLRAFSASGSAHLGDMLWNAKGLRNIGTNPGFERRGVATAMWHEGQRMASENRTIPAPKHSADRTKAGDAWARSVGGRLPRRKQKEA